MTVCFFHYPIVSSHFALFFLNLCVKRNVISLACDMLYSLLLSHILDLDLQPCCPFSIIPSYFCHMPICSILPFLGVPQLLLCLFSEPYAVFQSPLPGLPALSSGHKGQDVSLQIPNSKAFQSPTFIRSYVYPYHYSTFDHGTSDVCLRPCQKVIVSISYVQVFLHSTS